MKKNVLKLFAVFLVCFTFSCRVIIDAEGIIAIINAGGGTQGGSSTGGNSGSSTGGNGGSSGSTSGGNTTPYTPPSGSTTVNGGGQSLESVAGKFVRPSSGGNISLTPTSNSDIWYVFTNANSSSVNKPSYAVPSTYNNLIPFFNANIETSFSNLENSTEQSLAGVQIDYQDKPIIIKRSIDEHKLNNFDTKGGDFTTKTLNDATGEKKGDIRKFFDHSREFNATCRLKREVNTSNGKRILLIYTENNTIAEMPSDTEIAIIANAFLKDGSSNDIYDKITDMFGCDWGYHNYDYLNNLYKQRNGGQDFPPEQIGLIHNDGTITLLYCNVESQGNRQQTISNPNGYTGGYFNSGNVYLDYPEFNSRAMVTLHGPVASGEFLGKGLTTLAHEFQHLIHDQYYGSDLDQEYYRYWFDINVTSEENSSTNECFSSLAESYIADFIAQQSGQTVPGPFMVGNGGPNDRRGYLEEKTSDANARINGRGPYYLKAMDNVPLSAWNGSLDNYGIVASFAHYLLVNYGKDVVSAYMSRGIPNLQGIVEAINACNSNANMTRAKLLADWGTAVMLSSRTDMSSPYSINRHGWYNVGGLAVPSVNIWLYRVYNKSSYGVLSSSNNQLTKDVNTAYKVGSVSANQTFSAIAPQLQDNVVLTVVAVPK